MTLFDLELFRALNDEYRDRRVVPSPRGMQSAQLSAQAARRARFLDKRLSISGTRVLEIGCGRAQLGQVLTEDYGCEYMGVDIQAYENWSDMRAAGVDLRVHDITLGANGDLGQFDRIISLAVFEHVDRPLEGLEALRSLISPEGLVYLSANLYRGPKASHRYREVFFPFPHLLFSDEVFEAFYSKRGRPGMRPAWVNKLTAASYREKVRSLGFETLEEWYDETPLDMHFYERFIDVLGRYPQRDLELDFIHLVLQPAQSDYTLDDIPRFRHEIQQLERRLAMIERSTSWRLTAPLRALGDQLKQRRSSPDGTTS